MSCCQGHDLVHPLARTMGNATPTSKRMCMPMLYCETARTCSKKFMIHDEGTYSADSLIKRVLPDKNIINVAAKRFHCAGVMLQQHFVGKGARRFYETSLQNVMKCDVCIRRELYINVVSSGGTTMFRGIVEHMAKELTALAPFHDEIKVDTLPEREVIGGRVRQWTVEILDVSVPQVVEGIVQVVQFATSSLLMPNFPR